MDQPPVPEGGDGGDAAGGGGVRGDPGGGGGGGGGNGLLLQSSLGAAMRSSPTTRHTECDISRMPDSPLRSPGHRRAHSDMIGLPDDIDLAVPGDGPSLSSDENEEELFSMFLNVDKLNSPDGPASDSGSSCAMTGGSGGEASRMSAAAPGAAGVQPRHHHHSHSMDASSSISTEHLFGTPVMEGTSSSAQAKKAMSAAKLAELALIDPKKAKRIINNRQSAARSKERKMRYISELERKVQFMQREATALATQLALLQRDTAGLSAENSELKIRLQNTEHQVRLQDALNDALKSELQRLKVATGQVAGTGAGGMMNFGGPPFGGNHQPTMFYGNQAAVPPPPFLQAMQQQLPPNPPPMQYPLQQAQQLQQAAALGLNMRGPPPGGLSWGEAWSESSSG